MILSEEGEEAGETPWQSPPQTLAQMGAAAHGRKGRRRRKILVVRRRAQDGQRKERVESVAARLARLRNGKSLSGILEGGGGGETRYDDDAPTTTTGGGDEEEGRAQELEERITEENRTKVGRALRGWLPASDVLPSLMPVDMLAEQIVGDVDMEEEDAARKKRKGPVADARRGAGLPAGARKRNKANGASLISLLLRQGPDLSPRRPRRRRQQPPTKEMYARTKEEEEEQEALYFMTIWVEHHVDPVLEASHGAGACTAQESRSSSCSYILPFPRAPELFDLMQRMTLSTVRPYSANPFSTKPRRGAASGPTVYRT